MGHEVVAYGVIVGASYYGGGDFRKLQILNKSILRRLPFDNDWPWVDRSIFALPGKSPNGTYRRQIIHFGLSMTEILDREESWLEIWLNKFESVLKQLYWTSVRLHIETDFKPRREFTWIPTDDALDDMFTPPHKPISSWLRTLQILPGKKLSGT